MGSNVWGNEKDKTRSCSGKRKQKRNAGGVERVKKTLRRPFNMTQEIV